MVAQTFMLEEQLEKLINTLKQNREHVPIETLKSLYAEAYHKLTEEIRTTLNLYVRSIVCDDIAVCEEDQSQAANIINATVKNSNILEFIRIATYQEFDLEKVYSLAATLRILVIRALTPVLDQQTYYWFDSTQAESPMYLYNAVMDCFYIDDTWRMLEHGPGLLAVRKAEEM